MDKVKEFLHSPYGIAIVEGIKQSLRIALMAVIPVAITMLNKGQIDLKQLAIVGGVAILSFIDKTLHKYGKETDNERLVTGLTRF